MTVAEQNGTLTEERKREILATLTDPNDVEVVAEYIWAFMQAQGLATRHEIRTFLDLKDVPTPIYQKSFEQLCRLKLLTERAGDSGKMWAIQEWANTKSLNEVMATLATVEANKKKQAEYRDWFTVTGTMRLLTPCLASVPRQDDIGTRVFERVGERIALLSGYYRAMFIKAVERPGTASVSKWCAQSRISWDLITLPESMVGVTLRPVPAERPGQPGRGIITAESLAAGSIIPFGAVVPGSHVTTAQFEQIMTVAGRFAGFSPSAAHLGYGRFEVASLAVEVQEKAA